ncbi:MAG: hypothetical protein NW224_16995 [Leptolyngbyaceae cyanobacterium bins.302]|nr:hypothetical protein [Leptolyngbyaceae cyanobacterium bins.302]
MNTVLDDHRRWTLTSLIRFVWAVAVTQKTWSEFTLALATSRHRVPVAAKEHLEDLEGYYERFKELMLGLSLVMDQDSGLRQTADQKLSRPELPLQVSLGSKSLTVWINGYYRDKRNGYVFKALDLITHLEEVGKETRAIVVLSLDSSSLKYVLKPFYVFLVEFKAFFEYLPGYSVMQPLLEQ